MQMTAAILDVERMPGSVGPNVAPSLAYYTLATYCRTSRCPSVAARLILRHSSLSLRLPRRERLAQRLAYAPLGRPLVSAVASEFNLKRSIHVASAAMLNSLQYLGNFDEPEFLNCLRESLPQDLAPVLESALGMDLAISDTLNVNHFLYPLARGRFPTKDLKEYRWVLGETLSVFADESELPQLRVYAASLLLHAELHTPPHGGCSIPFASGTLVDAALASASDHFLAIAAAFLRHCVSMARVQKSRDNSHFLEAAALLLHQEILVRAVSEWIEVSDKAVMEHSRDCRPWSSLPWVNALARLSDFSIAADFKTNLAMPCRNQDNF